MRIYIAGSYSSKPLKNKWFRLLDYRLLTFFEKPKVSRIHRRKKLFLDSGAFSANNLGRPIVLQEYLDFIKINIENIYQYANLDVIGDVRRSWKNQEKMEAEGFSPLPVFHLEDDIKYLYKIIDNYTSFALGGMAKGFYKDSRIKFLDMCFSKIPIHCKVHGFGVTDTDLLFRYPWFSVDSTRWLMESINGAIIIPSFVDGKPSYKNIPYILPISNKNPSKLVWQKHLDTLSIRKKEVLLQFIHKQGYTQGRSSYKHVPTGYVLQKDQKWASKDKLSIEIIEEPGLSNEYNLRNEFNILYFKKLQEAIIQTPPPDPINIRTLL